MSWQVGVMLFDGNILATRPAIVLLLWVRMHSQQDSWHLGRMLPFDYPCDTN